MPKPLNHLNPEPYTLHPKKVARCCDTILSTNVLSTETAPLSPLLPASPHLVDDALSLSSTASSLSPAARHFERVGGGGGEGGAVEVGGRNHSAAPPAPAQPAAGEQSDYARPWRQASVPAMSDAPRVLAVAFSASFNSSLSRGNNVPGSCSPKVLFSLQGERHLGQRVRGSVRVHLVSSK